MDVKPIFTQVPEYVEDKDWKEKVQDVVRLTLFHKLVLAHLPNSALQFNNLEFGNVYAIAKKMETDFLEMATSRGEYYELVFDKCKQLQDELEEKHKQCQDQQQHLQQEMHRLTIEQSAGAASTSLAATAQQEDDWSDDENSQFQPNIGTGKEWQQVLKDEERMHLRNKLVLSQLMYTPDPTILHDNQMIEMNAFAKQIECMMYEMASSRSEYYHMVAEKMYEIQKNLEKQHDEQQ